MKICFYAGHKKWGGLANNGGSRTILKSAEVLRGLGHEVGVIANVDRFTYFPHPKPLKKIPRDTDVCISVSILDTTPMLKECPKKAKKLIWIRGWETWRTPEKVNKITLFKFRKAGGEFLVNSEWLQKKLESWDIKSKVLYPGYDEEFKPSHRLVANKLTIGVLYHKAKFKGYKFWLKVKKQLGDEYEYLEIGRKKLNDEGQIRLYQNCDIWFSAVTLEGLHNCALEAGLCGCAIVCNDAPRNGLGDYADSETAELYKKGDVQDAVRAIKAIHFSKAIILQERIKSKIKTRTKNMKGFIEWLK